MHIRKKFDENIPLRMFLENPTIAHLTNLLERKKQNSPSFEETSLPSSITPQYNQLISSSITHVLLTGLTKTIIY